jgi:hypothetical protein
MVRHAARKARRKAVSARAPPRRAKSKTKPPGNRLAERLAALEQERDALREELEREQARNRKLEEASAAARDRISWALDTLISILDGKG